MIWTVPFYCVFLCKCWIGWLLLYVVRFNNGERCEYW